MPTIAEYEAWKAGKQANEAGKANIVLSQPFPTEPDQFAADAMFAREASAVVGNPVPMSLVQDPGSRSVFEQIIAEKKRSTVLTQSPRLSEWLRAPDNAAVARDNLEGLSWWETFAGATGNAVIERGGMRVQQSYYQWLAEGAAQRAGDAERSFGDIYAEERANVGPVGNVLDNAIGPIGDLWNAGSRVVQSRLADMFGGDQEQAAAYYQQQVGIIGEKIAAMPMSPGAEKIRAQIGALEPSGDVVQDLTAFLGVATSDLAGFTAFLAETAAETAPVLAAGIGAGVVSRNPAVGAGVLGGGSYLQERYLAPSELLAERGIDISTPEGALAAVTDPDLMREAAERGEIRGLIIGALDTISGGVAGETLARNPVLNMVLQSLVQAAFGGGGEAAAQVASGQQFNISDVLIEGLAEFVTAPIEVGGMAASSVREAMTKAPAAEQHAVTLTEMATRAAADPVRNRMPDAFRDYLRTAMANTGAESLYIPADQFVEYFQGAGVDPFELADQLTGMSRADVEMAAETGGSVKIPTATWAADMAGGEHDQFIISNSTFAPDAMTAQEAAEFNARAQEALQEAWEEAEALRIEAESLRAIYDQERDELIGRLRAAGRATDVATAEALPMVEFRRVMAERMGLTPEEFAARYPLPQVQGERPEGLDPKNVDELTRTLAEARNRRAVGLEKRGPSLLEFIGEYGGIIDPGGELRARDAATVKRGRGKKTLRLERGGARAVGDMFGLTGGGKAYGFDDVARAAIEAGYLADDPVALEWQQAMREGREVPDIGRALLDAIDRELRGEAQYAGQAVEVEDGLASIEEYLAGLGLSLDDGDEAIRAAIAGAQQYDRPMQAKPQGSILARAQQRAEERIAEINRLNPQLSNKITIRWVDGSADPTQSNVDGAHGGFQITISRQSKNPDATVIHELRHIIDSLLGSATLTRTLEFMRKGGDDVYQALRTYLKQARDDGRIPPDTYEITSDTQVDAEVAGSVLAAYFNDREGLLAVAPELVELLDGMDAQRYAPAVEPMSEAALEGQGREYGQGAVASMADVQAIAADAGVTLDVSETDERITVSRIVASKKGEGAGSRVMAALTAYADATGKQIALTPSGDFGGTVSRLRQFYKRLGFVENKGRNKDFGTRETMIREPNAGRSYNQSHLFTPTDPTASPAFREWFGDSKVVDEQGKPLVVYHGGVEGIEQFESSSWRYRDFMVGEARDKIVNANFFAKDRSVAETYRAKIDGYSYRDTDPVGQTYEVYLSLQNPLTVDWGGQRFTTGDPTKLIEQAKAGGHDGLLVTNVVDDYRQKAKPTTIYVAFSSEQIKSVNNRGTFDPNDPRILNQADSGFTGGGRGSIQFPVGGVNQGETLVSLFQKADLSTFLHESGHYFLTVLQDAASLDPASPLAGEFETIKAWWRDNADAVARDAGNGVTADDVRNAIDNGTSGDAAKDLAIDTGMQEQFARATEAYLMEGKAPSPSLRQAFEKFRAWLVSIYKTMRGLNVNVTDELRGVFDRMLATDAEIAQARQDIGADVALTAADLGMTDEQYENFIKLRDQAKADASAKLLAETMAPIRRAREKWFKDERKKVHADVERNTNAQPVYRAIEWMGNRRWLGEDAPEGLPDIRFSKDVLVERYGEGVLSTLPRGQQTVYAVDGGLDPDDAAGWFGFSSGDAMVKAMERAPNRKDLIEAETDKVMRERHGDVLRDGSVEQEAMEAVHTDSRGRELATELQALNAVAGLDRGLTAKDAREMARRTLSGMRTRDAMNAGRFLAAERKAGQEVARLTGTVTREGMWMDRARRRVETQARGAVREQDGAAALSLPVEQANATTQRFNEDAARLVEAKRRQLLNHALYSEALAITAEVEKAERLASRLSKAIQRRRAQKGKQTISNDSLDAIAEILERYDFRRMSGPAEQRRGALNRYLESMVEQGRENEVAIPRKVLTDAAKVPYKTLLVDDLRGVVDTLRNLESTGRRWQKLIIAGKEREIAAAIDTITGSLKNNVGVKPAAWVEAGWQKTAGKGIKQYLATFTTASTVIRHMDGREDLGPVYELLKADIDNAAYTEREMREKAAEQIDALYSVYSEEEQREMAVMRAVPALGGRSFSKWNLIAMALNMGNAGNLHRLTNKKARQHLTPQQVEVVKGLLDKRDWDFVQSVWDYLDTYRPMIDERQKRTTGVSPEWVEATAVETPVGTYRGGYYPIKYAREQGGASTPSLDGDNDIIQSMKLGSYAKAATKNGHLEARVANVQQSLLLDVGVIGQHTNEVIHDLAFSESIVNSWRLLNDQRVSDALLDAGMQEQHEALKLWLKDVAVGQVFASDVLSRSLRTLRSGFTVSRLAFNVGTALLQPTGLMQSAVVVGKKNLASAITQYMRDPVGATNEVIGRSRIMGERRKVFQKDLMDMVAETNISAPTSSRFKKFMDRYAVPASLALMQYTQYYVVDVPTWMAAYSKGMTQFDGNQERAAQYADMTLNRVQGSGLWSERSNIERGTLSSTVRQNAFVTLFTTLGSYFFAKMNLLMERTNALRAEPVTAGAAFGYAFDVALLLAGEAAVLKLSSMAVEAALGGGDDEGEDENLAMYLSAEGLKVLAAGLPLIRDGVSVYQGFSGGTYASLLDLVVRPAQQASQGEFDAALVKSFVNLGGVVGRLPAAQANRVIDAFARQADGQDVAPMEFLLGRPR